MALRIRSNDPKEINEALEDLNNRVVNIQNKLGKMDVPEAPFPAKKLTSKNKEWSVSSWKKDDHSQYIPHSLAMAAYDFLVASGRAKFVKKSYSETKTILGVFDICVGIPGYPTFAAAVATLNTAGTNCILRLPAGTHAVTADLPANSNIVIVPTFGAVIAISDTKTLTINGSLEADPYRIFTLAGSGKVVFPTGAKVKSSWFASLADAITCLGTTSAELEITKAETVSADATLVATTKVSNSSGAILTIATTKTLTINGPLEAGPYQLFTLAGSGKVTFATGAKLKSSWFASMAAAIVCLGSTVAELEITKAETLLADTTLVATTKVSNHSGAILTIDTGKILTINGSFEAGIFQVFTCTTTGTVVFGAGTIREVYPDWFGTGLSALAKAVASITTSGGTVKLAAQTYTFDTVNWPLYINLEGVSNEKSILDCRGDGIIGTGKWYHQTFREFTITHASSSSAAFGMIDAKLGMMSCNFVNIRFIGKAGVSQHGLVMRGLNPATSTANNHQYHCRFVGLRFLADAAITGNALYFFGTDTTNTRCNQHVIEKCVWALSTTGWSTHVYLRGGQNTFLNCSFNLASVVGVDIVSAVASDSEYNVFINCSWDATWGATPKIRITNDYDAINFFFSAIECVIAPAQVSVAGAYPEKATYSITRTGQVLRGSHGAKGSLAQDIGTQFGTPYDDSTAVYCGGYDILGGKFIASGKDYAGSVQAISPYGGASVGLNRHGLAEYRIGNTINGTTYIRVLTINSVDGGISSLPAPTTKTVSAVSAADDTVTIAGHLLVTAQRVTFRQTGGADPGGLVSGTRYFVIVDTANTVQLATTAANAVAGTQINITSTGSGTRTLVTGGPVGSFTMPSDPSLVIDNPACNSTSKVFLSPTNDLAGILQGSNEHLYVTVADGRFTVTTAAGSDAASGETFDYEIRN